MSEVYKKSVTMDNVLYIKQDDDGENPREWDNIGKMISFHRNYTLGDEHDFSSKDEFLISLAQEYVSHKDIIQYVRDGNAEHLRIVYNRRDKHYELQEHWKSSGEWLVFSNQCYRKDELDMMADAIIENLAEGDLEVLIEQSNKVVMLPLYLYDHSGITMNTTGFSCPWDSGQVGWIYASKKRFLEETGYTYDELFSTDTKRKPKVGELVKIGDIEGKVKSITKKYVTVDLSYLTPRVEVKNVVKVPLSAITEVKSDYAKQMLINEVEIFDQYLTGDMYGFQLFKVDKEALQEYLTENDLELSDLSEDDLEEFIEETDSCWGFYGDDFINNGVLDNLGNDYRELVENLN